MRIIFLRKSIWPLREVIGGLERRESPLIKETTVIYLRDVYDHTIQVIETMETFRDLLSGILDVYLSSISNKMNEVMKVLAGVYGMNFRFMPSLGWYWRFFATLFVMAFIGIVMVFYFRKKKWL